MTNANLQTPELDSMARGQSHSRSKSFTRRVTSSSPDSELNSLIERSKELTERTRRRTREMREILEMIESEEVKEISHREDLIQRAGQETKAHVIGPRRRKIRKAMRALRTIPYTNLKRTSPLIQGVTLGMTNVLERSLSEMTNVPDKSSSNDVTSYVWSTLSEVHLMELRKRVGRWRKDVRSD
ncbi:hypothetical protein CROQUDRAFT_89513 [Cronartium quercuum f. sp. fusiforme G11]|uniref:Uncharacterized protein n=1 Tax=Cronartium quercuum f. sp. fusiforme G11 TaxID=708437 RepID=A0A9P6TEY6_9BASI|nr:hypothetical protein CROQUDRAFT_89513 [Cronartium quercuum f. sp. fusiforme G11]